jgi:hypothetical protein
MIISSTNFHQLFLDLSEHTTHTLSEDRMEVEEPISAADARIAQQTASLPWVEKYRPTELSELISQGDIVTTGKFIELCNSELCRLLSEVSSSLCTLDFTPALFHRLFSNSHRVHCF